MPEADEEPNVNLPEDHPEPTLPAGVADELRRVYTHRAFVPAEMDAAILAAGRKRLAAARRRRWFLRGAAGVAAAAAVVTVALLLNHGQMHDTVIAREDVDRNGRVDIVDALMLAQMLDLGVPGPGAGADVNHDGITNRSDVDAIAMQAVALPGIPRGDQEVSGS